MGESRQQRRARERAEEKHGNEVPGAFFVAELHTYWYDEDGGYRSWSADIVRQGEEVWEELDGSEDLDEAMAEVIEHVRSAMKSHMAGISWKLDDEARRALPSGGTLPTKVF
jgi:hypothetical protein